MTIISIFIIVPLLKQNFHNKSTQVILDRQGCQINLTPIIIIIIAIIIICIIMCRQHTDSAS